MRKITHSVVNDVLTNVISRLFIVAVAPQAKNENADFSIAIFQLLRHHEEWTGKGPAPKPMLTTIGWMSSSSDVLRPRIRMR